MATVDHLRESIMEEGSSGTAEETNDRRDYRLAMCDEEPKEQ